MWLTGVCGQVTFHEEPQGGGLDSRVRVFGVGSGELGAGWKVQVQVVGVGVEDLGYRV